MSEHRAPTWLAATRRVLDWRFVAMLTVLILSSTLCFGFVARGRYLNRVAGDRDVLRSQVSELLEQNKAITAQLDEVQEDSARRSKLARQQRLELLRALKAAGVPVPRDDADPSLTVKPRSSSSSTPAKPAATPASNSSQSATPRPSSTSSPATPSPVAGPTSSPTPTRSPGLIGGLLDTLTGGNIG